MPTSITVAPGLIQSPRTISGGPSRRPACRRGAHTAGKSSVLEWAMVTVAFSASSNCATGLPTMLERPITTASSPASEACTVLASTHAAERRARHQARQPAGEPAGIERMESVHVLVRIDGGDDLVGVDLRRQRQLHQNAVDLRVGIEPRDQVEQFGLAHAPPANAGRTTACRPRSPPWTCCGHRLRWRDYGRPAPPPAPARCRGRGAGGARRRSPCRAGRPKSSCRR